MGMYLCCRVKRLWGVKLSNNTQFPTFESLSPDLAHPVSKNPSGWTELLPRPRMLNILFFALRKKLVNNCILFCQLHTPFLEKSRNWVTWPKSMWFWRAQCQAFNCCQTHLLEQSLRSGWHEGKLLSSKVQQVVFPYTSDHLNPHDLFAFLS